MRAKRSYRVFAFHEAGHAVGHYFFPLSGRTVSLTISPGKLSEYNAGKHEANRAAGVHFSSKTLSSIVGRSVDQEQVHHELMALLAGFAADWLYAGDTRRWRGPSKSRREELLRHADGHDDNSRAYRLLCDAAQFSTRDVVQQIPEHDRQRLSLDELLARYGRPAIDAESERMRAAMDQYRREALAFVAAKWSHVQALADALFRAKTLSGDEAMAIIEAVEARIREGPPDLWTAKP